MRALLDLYHLGRRQAGVVRPDLQATNDSDA